jgi:hypothetical protein
MSAITITKNPFGAGPVPANYCVPFRFDISGELENTALQSSVELLFVDGASYVADEMFIFAGEEIHTGTEDWQVDLSSNTGAVNAQTFKDFIDNHPLFIGVVSTEVVQESLSEYKFVATWLQSKVVEDFDFDTSTLSTFLGVTTLQGLPDTFKDGWVFVYQLINDDTLEAITQLQKINPIYDSNGNVTQINLDLKYALNRLMKTTIPPMVMTGVVEDETIGLNFILKYGYRFMDGCNARFSKMDNSLKVWVINATVNDYDGEAEYTRYRYDGINEGTIRFLTTRPLRLNICDSSKDWLWVNLNINDFIAGINITAVKYSFFDSDNVAYRTHTQNIGMRYVNGTFILPAGLDQIDEILGAAVDRNRLCYYTIRILVLLGSGQSFWYTETYTFNYVKSCCEAIDFYFLDYPGGYTRITATKTLESSVDQTYTEVCKEVQCNDFESRLMTKKFITNSVATKRTTYECKFKNSKDIEAYLTSFKSSESKFMRYIASDGEDYLKRVVIETGSIRVFVKDERIVLNFTTIEEVSKILGE